MANENEGAVEMTDDHETQPAAPPARRNDRRDDGHGDDAEAIKAELEKTRKALKDANKEAADRRRRLEELERTEEERNAANLTESERIKKAARDAEARAAEAERKAREAEEAHLRTRIDMAVERAATAMGFVYPDIAASLIDRGRIAIDEDSGRPTGIKEALEKLVKDRPALVDASPRGGTPPREGPRRLNGGGAPRQPDYEADRLATGKYSV